MNTTSITYNVFQELENDLDVDAKNLKFYSTFNKILADNPRLLSNLQSTAPSKLDNTEIPDYLSPTNPDFYVALIPDLNHTRNYDHIEELRSLAILNHYMSLLTLQKNLWLTCYRSGTGQLRGENLPSNLSDYKLCFWPEIVRKAMINNDPHIPFNNPDGDDFEDDTYRQFVDNYRTRLNDQYQHLENKFNAIKTSFERYTDAITDTIEKFVRKEGLQAFQLHFDARLTLIKYDYTDRLLKYEYFRQKPNDQQIEIARSLCQLTFDKEKEVQEFLVYRYGDCYHRLPRPFNLLKESLPTMITDLRDVHLREHLSSKYTRIIEHTIADVMHLYTIALQSIRCEYEKKYNTHVEALWKRQHQLPQRDRLTSHMVQTIHERQRNIIACIQHIYNLRIHFFCRCPS